MNSKLLHTPDGVRDLYNEEYKKKLSLQDKLHQVFVEHGCIDIQTPTFEYFDVFSNQIGTTPSKDLFKFFDSEGNTVYTTSSEKDNSNGSFKRYSYGDDELFLHAFIIQCVVVKSSVKYGLQGHFS